MDKTIIYALISSSFVYGLASSLHCVGMCGPFVSIMNLNSKSKISDLFYHFGRMVSYFFIGLALGYLAEGIDYSGNLLQLQEIAGGVSAVLLVFFGIALFRFGNIFSERIKSILSPLLKKISSGESKNNLLFGLVSGFLPCGVLYPAFAAAFASGNALAGGISMLAFFAGTFPLLYLIGRGSRKLGMFRPSWIPWLGLAMIVLGLITVYVRFSHQHGGNTHQHHEMHH